VPEWVPLAVVRYQDPSGAVDEMVEVEKIHRVLLEKRRKWL
jgi:hypothetical protein